MSELLRYALSNGDWVSIETDEVRPAGGAPVSGGIDSRLHDTRQHLKEAMAGLPSLLKEVQSTLVASSPTLSEVTIEFGIRLSAEVGLIVAKSQAEANFAISVTWKREDQSAQ